MFILMATPEAYPFAQAGNLTEVVYGLASSLVRGGHRVSVVLPLYREVREQGRSLTSTGIRLAIPLSMKNLEAEVYHTALKPDFDFYFIVQDSLYNRDGLYGTCYGDFQDNAEPSVSTWMRVRWAKPAISCGCKSRPAKAVAGRLGASLAGVMVTWGPKRRQRSCGVWD